MSTYATRVPIAVRYVANWYDYTQLLYLIALIYVTGKPRKCSKIVNVRCDMLPLASSANFIKLTARKYIFRWAKFGWISWSVENKRAISERGVLALHVPVEHIWQISLSLIPIRIVVSLESELPNLFRRPLPPCQLFFFRFTSFRTCQIIVFYLVTQQLLDKARVHSAKSTKFIDHTSLNFFDRTADVWNNLPSDVVAVRIMVHSHARCAGMAWNELCCALSFRYINILCI